MLFLLKLLLKIVAAPVVVVLALFNWVFLGFIYISSTVMNVISFLFIIFGVLLLIVGPRGNGVIVLVIAWLLSPVGLPLIALLLLEKLQELRYLLQTAIYK